MANGSLNITANIAGQSFSVAVTRTSDGSGVWTPEVTAGTAKASTDWEKTDADTGTATMATGHGFTTGDTVDVFWADGSRYGMTATVAGNDVALDGGDGDDLPASDTSMVLCSPIEVNGTVDPDDLAMLVIASTKRARVTFVDSGEAVLYSVDMAANEFTVWFSNSGITCPMTGNPVTKMLVSSGDTANAAAITVAAMYDATP